MPGEWEKYSHLKQECKQKNKKLVYLFLWYYCHMEPTDKQKNPWAVNVGGRLQQARQMANFTSLDLLLEQLPSEWHDKRSRFTNYEAGISLAPPDIVIMIAEATNCSACWIMFGSGPIRDNGRDIQAVRHQNLEFMVDELRQAKKLTGLYKGIGLSRHKVDEYIQDPFKKIEDRLSRKIEKHLKLTSGWMDEQHIENDPVCRSFPDDLRELMTLYSNADQKKRQMLMKIARVIIDK